MYILTTNILTTNKDKAKEKCELKYVRCDQQNHALWFEVCYFLYKTFTVTLRSALPPISMPCRWPSLSYPVRRPLIG